MDFEIRRVLKEREKENVKFIPGGDNATAINIESLDENARKSLKYLLITYFDKNSDKILDVNEQKELLRMAGRKITKDKLNELFFVFQVPEGAARKVLTDILPLVKTRASDTKRTANDIAYIRKIILPSFVKLYENWREGYEFLIKKMSGRLNIVIVKYDCHKLHMGADGLLQEERALGMTSPEPNDKCVITMNAYDKVSRSSMEETMYHEIMHAISLLAVKDKGESECRLSNYFDLKYKKPKEKYGKLTRLALKYTTNQKDAMAYAGRDLLAARKKVSKEEIEEFNGKYTEIRSKFGCWANRRQKNDTAFNQFLDFCWVEISNSEELLAQGLSFYYGSQAQRKILRQYEPWLYGLIDKSINGKLNGFINKSFSYKAEEPKIALPPADQEGKNEFAINKIGSAEFIPAGDGKTRISIKRLNDKQKSYLAVILAEYIDADANKKLNAEELEILKAYVYLEITPKKLKQLDMAFKDLTFDQDQKVLNLLGRLKSRDPKKRIEAIAELREAYSGFRLTKKKKQILNAVLVKFKSDPDPEVRIAASAWSWLDAKAVKFALPHMIGRLKSEKNVNVRLAIVRELGVLYHTYKDPKIMAGTIHGLIIAEYDENQKVRKEAKEIWRQIHE